MTVDELHGRMIALETITMTSLGLYLANSGNDPDMSKARALLDYLRGIIVSRTIGLSDEAARAAEAYGDDLLSQALENLRLLRGGG